MSDRTPEVLEPRLLEMWRSALDDDSFGAADNFFAEGGDSLLALRLLATIRTEFDLPQLSVRSIFRNPTVQQFTAFLSAELDQPDTADS
jgi:aryl carrier-like protein